VDIGLDGAPEADSNPATGAAPDRAAPTASLATASLATAGRPSLPSDLAAHLDAVEREILEHALEVHRYNRTAAGASLGLSLRQMRYRMARLGIGGPAADGGAERSEADGTPR
jgi:two-component system response regulator PilR (NtrC family)